MISYLELTQEQYFAAVKDLILPEELYIANVYDNGDHNATVGYGYNLVVRSNNVYNFQAAGIVLSPEQTAVLAEIDRRVAAGESRTSITEYALANFYKTITEPEAQRLFEVILPEYELRAEQLAMPYSKERATLVSLCYNRGVHNPKLRPVLNAIEQGDRAEAWFQIRYNSQTTNPLFLNGIANRRYRESDTFGLYNDEDGLTAGLRTGENDVDAKGAYRVYTRHRETPITIKEEVNGVEQYVTYNGIRAYEERFSTAYDGYTEENNSIIAKLNPAYNYLTQQYITAKQIGFVVTWDHVYVGEDATTIYYRGSDADSGSNAISGSAQSDLIFGESGNDVLLGGAGEDIYYGGKGNDTFSDGRMFKTLCHRKSAL